MHERITKMRGQKRNKKMGKEIRKKIIPWQDNKDYREEMANNLCKI